MGIFRHTIDGDIIINSTVMPLSFFITLEPTYALPFGAIRADYTQGVAYIASSEGNIITSSVTYPDGDTYIANEATYLAAYNSYTNPAPPLSEAKERKIFDLTIYAGSKKFGNVNVTVSATPYVFFSIDTVLDNLVRYNDMFTRSSMPVGFYVNDINYAQIIMPSITDLRAIIDRIIELYYLVELNIDVHRAAINALTTVPDVDAYDYTTGWPTIPY